MTHVQQNSVASCCAICSCDLSCGESRSLDLDLNLDLGEGHNDPSVGQTSGAVPLSLSQDIEVFFILRNVLNLPTSLMEGLMGLAGGGGPSQWGLGFCDLCRRMVQEAGFLFSRIRQLIKEYEMVGERLRGRAKVRGNVNATGFDENPTAKVTKRGRGRPSSSKGQKVPGITVLSRIQQHFKENGTNRKNNNSATSEVNVNAKMTFRKGGLQIQRKNVNSIYRRGTKRPLMKNKILKSSPSKANDVSQFEIEPEPGNEPGIVIKTVTSIPIDITKTEPESEPEAGVFDNDFYYEGVELDLQEENAEGELIRDSNLGDEDCDQELGLRRRSLRPRKIGKTNFGKVADSDSGDDKHHSDEDVQFPEDEFLHSSDEEGSDFEMETDPLSRKRARRTNLVKPKPKCVQKSSPALKGGLELTNWPLTLTRPHLTARAAPLHQCPYCPCSVKGSFSLDAHILRVHQGVSQPFPCDLCPQLFSKLSTVMLHIDLKHSSEIKNDTEPLPDPPKDVEERSKDTSFDPTESRLFNAIFTVEEVEIDDVANNKPPAAEGYKKRTKRKPKEMNSHLPYKCDRCSFHFSTQWLVDAHILRCHYGDARSFECDKCTRRFARKIVLNEHRATQHPKITTPYDGPKTPLATRIAELERKTKRKIITDIPPPKVKKIYTCTKCNVKFESRISCEVHLKRVHEGSDKKLPCPSCDKHFLSITGQKTHYDQTHVKCQDPDMLPLALKNQVLKCTEPDCTHQFRRQTDLHQHLKFAHAITKQHMCELCSMLFTELASLRNHQLQAHHGELDLNRNPFKCEFCDKVLNTRRNLEAHKMHAHTKEFKHMCPHCPRGFAQDVHRKYHIKIVHQKDKPYRCPHPGCGKQFPLGFYLKSHMRVHTGEKPWSCKFCGKGFSDKSTYNRHIESHGEKVHLCPTCGKEFKVWHTYRIHVKSHEKGVVRRRKPNATGRSKTNRNRRKRKEDTDEDTSNSDEEQESNSNSGEINEGESNSNQMPILTRDEAVPVGQNFVQEPPSGPPVLLGYSQQQPHFSLDQNSICTFPFPPPNINFNH